MYNYVFSALMLINSVLASYQAVHTLREPNRAHNIKILTSLLSFASALWSLCFGFLFLMTSTDAARVCRGIGLIGAILYLVSAEVLVGELTSIRKRIRHFLYLLGGLGFILIPFISSKSGAVYYMTEHGMAFKMPSTITNSLYSAYCAILALVIVYFIYNIISKAELRRIKALGYGLVSVGAIIILGMVADTILPPVTGIDSFPASSIAQFWGVAMFFMILRYYEKSNITLDNMSEFIYYSLSVPVIIYDPYMNPCISNDAVYDFLGKDRMMTGFSEISLEALFGIKSKEISDSKETHLQYETKCLANGVMCRITIDAINDRFGDTLGYIVNINDISAHILALEKVEEAKALAEESNRSKSIFLANVSHELRTPMNSIVGFSELLLNSDLPLEEKEYVSDIRRASNAMLEIIQNVLDLSYIEAGTLELQKEEFNTKDMFRDICRIIEPVITVKDVVFKTDISEELPSMLNGDKKRIKDIITNLLGFAIRNTDFGSVTLHAVHRSLPDGRISLHLEIKDTGKGLKQTEIDKLFDTFSQVDGHVHQGVEGSGLELALTKRYINYMDGQISVVSKLNYGSCFTVDIPIDVTDTAPIGNVNWSEASNLTTTLGRISFSELKVLVVDDSKINVKVFSHILKTYGIEPDCVYGGAASIECCKEKEYNIIFMDQMMPEMDGIEAMKRIRKISEHYATGSTCQIIAFTANAVTGAEEALIKEGFDSYMSKPIDLNVLEVLLQRV